uniref:glucuronosyltransferase n=1 Tax=Parascaris univalens TaxID=6257 RepID=A0A915AZM7_PARUN
MSLFRLSLVILFAESFGYKILIYSPQIGHSHVNFFGQIADTLVEAGHDAVLYVPAFYEEVKTTGAKLARVIERPLENKLPYDVSDVLPGTWTEDGRGLVQVFTVMIGMAGNIKPHCDMQLADKKLMDRLREEKFDLGITEVFNVCGYAIFHNLGIRTHISAFATNIVDVISSGLGVVNNPSYVPASFTQLSDVMSYSQRLENVISYSTTFFLFQLLVRPYINFNHVAPGFDIDKAVESSAFAFVNSEEFVEYPRPINHKIVFIAGIGVKQPQPLDEEYERIMENAKGSVVLVSFGSVAKSSEMPSKIKDAFVGMFARFPEVTFIWKYEKDDDVAANVTNVIKKKWVPQNDLFGHPKLGAFITHGGQNSVIESTNAGIPMICVPLFGDQMRNAKVAEKRRVAFLLDKRFISSDSLSHAIRTVLYNQTYGESAKRLAQMIRKKPISARERVIKYTEFAAEFGPFDNLNSAGVRLNFFQYYMIDILLPAAIILMLFTALSALALIRLTRLLLRFRMENKQKQE